MTSLRFALKPFPGDGGAPGMTITGTIGRRVNVLSVRYTVLGDLSEVALPAPGGLPARKNRLWEETCLELFVGDRDCARYWEFNLSPAGHWNAYRFTSFRRGMREEPAFASLPFRVRTGPDSLALSLELKIGKILPPARLLEASVAAVIKTRTGGTSHWALAHPGPRPDFHRRDAFTLKISAT